MKKPVYLLFVDLNAAFDHVERSWLSSVDIVIKWSEEWKLNLNAEKSEVSFFTVASMEIKFKPTITIGEEVIKVNPNLR